jgi:light-regulated signal transduction histidine kinase (bacteriophytochrome)
MPEADPSGTQIDLTKCDQEPIHLPGAILPHGAMLVLDRETLAVLQVAGDTEALLGQPLQALLGQTLHSLLQPEQTGLLRSLDAESGLSRPRYLLDPALRVTADRPVDASVFRDDRLLVVEFEAADPASRFATDPLVAAQEMLEGLVSAASIVDLCQAAASRVRRVTGYDRVMVYRFQEDGCGWVVAESRRDDLISYLNFHYPAEDIPKQARALYLKNPIRLITRVDYDPAPLMPPNNPLTGKPLDMTFATLRDVAPVHRQYLRNMGVDASMSVSIIVKGRLWGLVACHHQTPLRLSRHLRAVCELFGAMLSLQFDVHDRREQIEARLASRDALQRLMIRLAIEDDYARGIVKHAADLLEYIRADGLALFDDTSGGGVVSFGPTPSPEQLAALVPWLTRKMAGEETFATDRLGELRPDAEEFGDSGSGLLALSVSREPRRLIMWFRPAIIQTVTWGGDPTKPVEPGPNGLNPRSSFAAWRQIVRGRSLPWTRADLDAAFDLRVALLEVVLRRIEAAARERQRAQEHERLLMSELDHRVKNTLGVIQSLLVQTSRSATSLTDFVSGLERRIRAMAQSHSLLTQSHWTGVEIHTLLHEEMDQYGQGSTAVTLAGPDLVLTPKASLALSLAVHELATNAAKYGALAAPQGRVSLTWSRSADGGIALHWVETGGAAVSPPQRRGFGSKLIEEALAMETGGRAVLSFPPEGVRCDIVLAAAAVVGTASGAGTTETTSPPPGSRPPETAAIGHKRVLIVEDSFLISMLLEQILEERGWDMIGPATRVPAALALARSERIDAALLDINLDGEMSWEVATALRERGIPFAFSTGYGAAVRLPDGLADAVVLKKPFQINEVESCLVGLLGGTATRA